MNITTFAVELHTDTDGIADRLVILGAGNPDDPFSVINDDESAWDLVLTVEPSEDRAPYDAALTAAGFIPVGDDQARRA